MILAIARQKAHDRGIRADSPLLTRSISEPRVARCKNSKIDFGCNLAPGLSNQDNEDCLERQTRAIGAVGLQLITSDSTPVTAEAAGSSPVVPAIFFKHFARFSIFLHGSIWST